MFNFGCSLEPSTGLFTACIMLIQFFNLTPTSKGRGILSKWKLNVGNFNIHWNSLLVLSYVLCFIIFTCIFVPYTNFSNYHAPTLVSGIFVETGLQQYTKFQESFYKTALLPALSLYFSKVKNKETLDLKKITS